jgi:hypothetical protein
MGGLGNDTSIDSEKPEKESFFTTPLHVAKNVQHIVYFFKCKSL